MADLQRRLHEAARSFEPPADAVWDRANLPPAGPAAIVCHNDLCVENVVVRDGERGRVHRFRLRRAQRPAHRHRHRGAALGAVPRPGDLYETWAGIDQVARFRAFCDVHGLDAAARGRVVEAGKDFLDRALVSVRTRAESGLPLYVAFWEGGYADQNRRSRAWLDAATDAVVS